MRKLGLIFVISALLILILWSGPYGLEEDNDGNLVWANLAKNNFFHTEEDSIENILLEWIPTWHVTISNHPDGSPPVINPLVELWTELNIANYWPSDPLVFSHEPGTDLYIWDFDDLEIPEPDALSVYFNEPEDPIIALPRFRAERSVDPEILRDEVTTQTTFFTFTLEEPLPPEINSLWIAIGHPVMVYQDDRLVETSVISWTDVEGWSPQVTSRQIIWHAAPSNVEVGKTYQFQVTLENTKKSDLLIGSPLYKPPVQVNYQRAEDFPVVPGYSVMITDRDNLVQVTLSSENEVDWWPNITDSSASLIFDPIVSELTPPPPPFYVLIDADLRLEPEVLSLKERGVVTAFVKLPHPYMVEDIDISTVMLQNSSAKRGIVTNDIMILKFKADQLEDISPGTHVEFLLKGELSDGSIFKGTDHITVIQ